MNLSEIENKKIPRGTVTLVGLGRLGIRTGINLLQIHRGGPKKIKAIDAQRISAGDLIFQMLGGKIGMYKVDLLNEFKGVKEVVPVTEYINNDNINLIDGDVVSIQIAGGDTVPLTAKIIKKAWQVGAKTFSTAGVFGIGTEKIRVMDISKADDTNPVVKALRKNGIRSNHKIITTGKFIRDYEPVTPYVLDEIARITTQEIIKALKEIK